MPGPRTAAATRSTTSAISTLHQSSGKTASRSLGLASASRGTSACDELGVGGHLLSQAPVAEMHLVEGLRRRRRVDGRHHRILLFRDNALPQQDRDPACRAEKLLAVAE